MDNSTFTTKNIVKYLVIGGLIYAILRMIPSQQIANKDLLLVMGVIVVGFVTIDCLFNKDKKEGFANDSFSLDVNLNVDELLKKRALERGENFAESQDKAKEAANRMFNQEIKPEIKTNDIIQEIKTNDIIQEIKPEILSSLPKTDCAIEVSKIKGELEKEIQNLRAQMSVKLPETKSEKLVARYFENLVTDLTEKGILDRNDIENIQLKMSSKLLSMDEVIASLETLKKEGKPKTRVVDGKVKNDMIYNELPSDFYTPLGDKIANQWDNEYTILNTNKWAVPMPRPPVCINTSPCKVCPSDSSNYPVSLKEWDDARYVTQTKINKAWAEDQANAKTN
jgi:hypothetical protein